MATLSAGVNFGYPNTDFIIESDEHGVAQSCRNVDTGIEYVGGGSSDETFIIEYDNGDGNALNKTWAEINTAFNTYPLGRVLILEHTLLNGPSYVVNVEDDGHGGYSVESNTGWEFFTDSEDGYPVED